MNASRTTTARSAAPAGWHRHGNAGAPLEQPLGGTLATAAVLLCLAASVAWSTPVRPHPVELTQPDGSTLVVWPRGDEWLNWTSCEGYAIVQDADGWWRYGLRHGDRLVPGAARAGVDPVPASAVGDDELADLAADAYLPPTHAMPLSTQSGRSVQQPVLVILVEFTDQALTTSDTYWHNLFFGAAGKTVGHYYDEVSAGGLELVPAWNETSGVAGDGIVRVQLATYDHNGGQHPDTYDVIDDRNRWIVNNALYHTTTLVWYPTYDDNLDWQLTPDELHIVVVVAGYEHGYAGPATPTPAVHGHHWSLGGSVPAVPLQGVTLCNGSAGGGYCQVGETHTDHAATIGVICHELGHDLGLPDLYDTTAVSAGIGAYGVMSYGDWGRAAGDSWPGETPVHPCAWSKLSLGFATATPASGNHDYTLYAAGGLNYNIVKVATTDPNQYFLLENRQLQGFDAGLYEWFAGTPGGSGGGGLAIWHADDSVANNNNYAHKRVDLEEANQGTAGYSELDTLTYLGNREHLFYAGHAGDFGDATTPDSRLYTGGSTNLNVSAISVADAAMKGFVATETATRLAWSTFLGGVSTDEVADLAVDTADNVYVTGRTYSDDFPTTPGAYDTVKEDGGAAFVTKFDATGGLVYSTLLETTYVGPTMGRGIAVDSAGNAYVTGRTADYYPTTAGAYDTTYNGDGDVFVTKLNTTGTGLVYSTYLGSGPYPGSDDAWGIAVDSYGNAFVTGQTNGSSFPRTTGSSYGGNVDAFVTGLNSAGSNLLFSRYLGHSEWDVAYAIDVGSGEVCVGGETGSAGFPTTTGAFDNTLDYVDAFVSVLSLSGNITYSTLLGGSQTEAVRGIAVDAAGYVYATGTTRSPGGVGRYPVTTGAFDEYREGASDAFVTKLDPTPYASLVYSTYLGGDGSETGLSLALSSANEAYVAGVTSSTDFPTAGAYADTLAGDDDAFQSVISADGSALPLSTYLGGSGTDQAWAMGLASDGSVYVAGWTTSADFPTTAGSYAPSYAGGNSDGFIARLEPGAQVVDSVVVGSPDGGETWCLGATAAIRWSSSGAGDSVDVELSRSGPTGPWETLYAGTLNDGVEIWTVAGSLSTDCYLRATDAANGNLLDMSNAAFAIADCAAGDFNGDGSIDLADFGPWEACLGAPGDPAGPGCETGDFDSDGDVDLVDFAELQVAFTG